MTKNLLIIEQAEDVSTVVVEENGRKNLYIEGVFLQAGIKNRNGRVYPPHVMEGSVARYVRDRLERGTAYGEFGHPPTPIINPERISHRITELRRDGNNWIGKAVILDEGYGKIARNIIETGGTLGVSSRAVGSMKKDRDAMVVQEDLKLSTAADIVTDPSAPDAFVSGIFEGAEWIYDAASGSWQKQERIEEQAREIKKMSRRRLEECKVELFQRFLKSL